MHSQPVRPGEKEGHGRDLQSRMMFDRNQLPRIGNDISGKGEVNVSQLRMLRALPVSI